MAMPPFTLNLKQRRARKHMPPKPEALDCVLPPAANPPTARPPARQRHRAPGQFLPPPRRHVQRRRGRVSRSTPCDRTPWTPAGHLPPPLRARNGAGRGRSALFVASLAGSRFAGEWPCGRRRRPGLDGISFTIRPIRNRRRECSTGSFQLATKHQQAATVPDALRMPPRRRLLPRRRAAPRPAWMPPRSRMQRASQSTQMIDLATVKAIGCSSLRGGGGELGTLKTLTYGFN